MSFTETTRTSWFSRLKGGVAKIFIGLLLVLAAIVALFWNEGRSVKTYQALNEGAGIVLAVENTSIDPANDGKLVHISGSARIEGTLQDPVFGIAAQEAARLSRRVEMFQWVEEKRSETRKTLGGGEETVTVYSYNREWRQGRVNSGNFREQAGHDNPALPVESETFTAAQGTVGAFTIDGSALANLGTRSDLRLSSSDTRQIKSALGTGKRIFAQGNTAIISNNPDTPQIGDLKISFTRADTGEVSFVGAQRGNALTGYQASNGRTVFLSQKGAVSAAEMFEAAQSENTVITWVIRAAGLLFIFAGFAMTLSLLGIIADVIPFAGSIVRFGTSLIALILTLLIGPLVIAIAWFAYRPVLSIAILGGGLALAAATIFLRRGRSAVSAPAAAAPGFGRNAADQDLS